MRSVKFVVLAAGALGVLAFFLPFFHFELGSHSLDATPYQLLFGFDDPKLDVLGTEGPECIHEVMPSETGDVVSGTTCDPKNVHHSYVPMYFLSSIGLVLVGLYALVRRRLSGTPALFVALPASLLAIGGWLRELKLDRTSAGSHTTTGAVLLGLSGLVALIATIALLVRPEPRRVKKPPVAKPPTLPTARVVR